MESTKKENIEKDDSLKIAEAPKKEATKKENDPLKKYLVISNFTADKQYYKGNYFASSDAKLIGQLLNSKLIK
jgi:hypothetical protein